ncbi:hypothetical protein [Streptomonospora salina]|uniref:Uncharacterized protein n=1 Tax=Streptomonospora salina TaxID=104205 RepID=A0A841E3H1_9ACTN|nr:hypothetical protein [Streptomonospora salina]MBB5998387.1 hypothetical protein [Streptomonospora salina]
MSENEPWFPGRWVSGCALILGPLLWLAGLLVRGHVQRTVALGPEERAALEESVFAAPEQLALYEQNPGLVTAGYALFALGAFLLWPAFAALARMCVERSPRLAIAGGVLLITCQFARLYVAGVEQSAFQTVDDAGLEHAISETLENYQEISYGPWRIAVTVSALQYLGAPLLAAAAYRAGVLGTGRALLLVVWATVWSGVLKESDLLYAGSTALALCVALVPLGTRMLLGRLPEPSGDRRLLSW